MKKIGCIVGLVLIVLIFGLLIFLYLHRNHITEDDTVLSYDNTFVNKTSSGSLEFDSCMIKFKEMKWDGEISQYVDMWYEPSKIFLYGNKDILLLANDSLSEKYFDTKEEYMKYAMQNYLERDESIKKSSAEFYITDSIIYIKDDSFEIAAVDMVSIFYNEPVYYVDPSSVFCIKHNGQIKCFSLDLYSNQKYKVDRYKLAIYILREGGVPESMCKQILKAIEVHKSTRTVFCNANPSSTDEEELSTEYTNYMKSFWGETNISQYDYILPELIEKMQEEGASLNEIKDIFTQNRLKKHDGCSVETVVYRITPILSKDGISVYKLWSIMGEKTHDEFFSGLREESLALKYESSKKWYFLLQTEDLYDLLGNKFTNSEIEKIANF